ncbi:MAG: hypothetical protein JWQ66_4683 [Mucilaginibacter sp.]|nr:hypothetical protein [Mucilaginibacter sp.]
MAWCAFIIYELVSVYFVKSNLTGLPFTLIFYALYINLFYFHSDVVLPYAFSRSKMAYGVCLVLVLAEIGCCLGLKYLLEYYGAGFRLSLKEPLQVSRYLFFGTWRILYFLAFSSAYWMIRRLFHYRAAVAESEKRQLAVLQEKAVIEKDLAEVRYAFLQQQISPHFLFNTLNFVYNSIYQLSPVASQLLLQLAEMMRYSLQGYEDGGKAELSSEIGQVRNLIGMNRSRYDFELYLDYRETGVLTGLSIIPLVLLTFTENVFKHGYLKDPLHPAQIALSVDQGRTLKFVTWNLKKPRANRWSSKNTGVKNAIRRLDYTYGNRYRLDLTDEKDAFKLELTILL